MTSMPKSSAESTRLSTFRLHGVLSRSVIMKNDRSNKNSQKNKKRTTSNQTSSKAASSQPISKRFLIEAMHEAMLRQELILEALDNELTKYEGMVSSSMDKQATKTGQSQSGEQQTMNQDKRPVQQKIDSIGRRRVQIMETIDQIKALKKQISKHRRKDVTIEHLRSFKNEFEALGFASILKHDPDTWKTRMQKPKDYGRPDGFDGLVFYTPRGVPILVGRPKVHKDETLRRIAQRADLWFQVEDYQGSRVLLRSSLQPGLKDSKECKQMAANLAARYSDWYFYHSDKKDLDIKRIPVMYCDSRKVTKQGSRVGRMRHRKKLGRMYGDPNAVEELTANVEIPPKEFT